MPLNTTAKTFFSKEKPMMTRKEKIIVTLAVVFVLGIVSVALAHKAGYCNFNCGPGDFKAEALSHIDEKVAELNLTPQQQAKYQELRATLEDRLEQGKLRHQALHDELKALVSQPAPDIKDITAPLRAAVNTIPAHIEEHLDLLEQFYTMLTPEQQSHLLDEVRKHMDFHS